MKKTLKAFLCGVLLLFFSLSALACDTDQDNNQDEHPLTIAVLSDIHLLTPDEIKDPNGEKFVDYTNKKQTMLHLSEAIYKSEVDSLIEQKPDVVLMTGDLSQTGSKKSLQVVADGCKKLKQAGIQVYVTGGITDFSQEGTTFDGDTTAKTECVTKEEFKTLFADYGYNQALSREEGTLSYTVDMDENHRLLVLDTASLYDYENEADTGKERSPKVSDELMEYIETVVEEARNARKEVLVMSYFPLNDSVGDAFGQMTKRFIVAIDRQEDIVDLLTEYGVQYVVSGHIHAQNCTVFENQYCNLNDYTSSSATCYPLEILYMTADEDKYTTEEKPLSTVKEEYIPSYISAEEKLLLQSEPVSYAKKYLAEHIKTSAQAIIDKSIGKNKVKNGLFIGLLLSLDYCSMEELTTNERVIAFGESIYREYTELMNMTLYGEENSIESVCKGYGIELPKTENMKVQDFFVDALCKIFADDIQMTGESDEITILKYICYEAIRRIAYLDLCGELQAMRPDIGIKYFDLKPVADKMFNEDVIDINMNLVDPDGNEYNVGAAVISIVEPFISDTDIRIGRAKLSVLGCTQIDTVLSFLNDYFDDIIRLFGEYSNEDDTLFGLKIHKYLDFEKGQVYIGKLFGDALIDIFAKDLLF